MDQLLVNSIMFYYFINLVYCSNITGGVVSGSGTEVVFGNINCKLFPSEAIHQRILLYNKLIIARAITNLLYSKV